ncbi:MAG: hypothetical protein J5614_01285 [Paludibacteraceae bacterium]|nr:hypothetical protein [Paludibacteraceae bacterium]
MNLLNNIKALAKTGVQVAKIHLPEELLVGGIISLAAALYSTAKGTVSAISTVEEHNLRREAMEEDEVIETNAIVRLYSHTSLELANDYAPAAAFTALSLACFCSSYGILKKRYVALGAAYTALNESFMLYRKRVIEDKGADQDIYYLTGVKPKSITVANEDGEKEKKKVLPELPDGSVASPYVFKFGKYKENGERNLQWQDNAILNMSYVMGHQDYLNDQLYCRCMFDKENRIIKRGAVMLNEIRDLLGEDANSVGSVVGNRFGNGEPGCNGYIDFRPIEGYEIDPKTGKEIPYIIINPNVDGLIYDLLDKFEEVPFKANYLESEDLDNE